MHQRSTIKVDPSQIKTAYDYVHESVRSIEHSLSPQAKTNVRYVCSVLSRMNPPRAHHRHAEDIHVSLKELKDCVHRLSNVSTSINALRANRHARVNERDVDKAADMIKRGHYVLSRLIQGNEGSEEDI